MKRVGVATMRLRLGEVVIGVLLVVLVGPLLLMAWLMLLGVTDEKPVRVDDDDLKLEDFGV